ncbi:MAG: YdgA family protein [Gammaproteobacteria bacterium]|nr:YdgA family protein [Gammaproteobacteria bacterium]
MKKILLLSVILLLVVMLGLPGAVGMVAERQHRQLVHNLSTQGKYLSEEQYERSWFSSRTRYSYRIEDERLRKLISTLTRESDGIPVLQVDSTIFHGPVPALSGGADHAVLAWSDIESILTLRSASGVEFLLPGELHSRIEADGSSRFIYHADAESRPLGNGMQLRWEQADVDVAVGRGANTIDVSGIIGTVELADSTAALVAGPTRIDSSQQRSDQGIWSGDTKIAVEAISTPGFTAKSVLLNTRIRESSGQASYALDLGADNVQGEGFAGDGARLELSAQRLDAVSLARFLQLIDEHSITRLPPAERDALMTRLLSNGPEVSLKTLKLPTRTADIEGDAFVSIKPGTGLDLNDVARNTTGNAQFLLPSSVVEHLRRNSPSQLGNVIDMMMRYRFLRPEGNRYRIEAEYADALLTVNGFPVPVPVF